jgi:hypothetical protein
MERFLLKICGFSERKKRRESFFTPGRQAVLRKKASSGQQSRPCG